MKSYESRTSSAKWLLMAIGYRSTCFTALCGCRLAPVWRSIPLRKILGHQWQAGQAGLTTSISQKKHDMRKSMNIYEHLWNPQRCRQILPSFIIISKLFCKIGPPGRPHSRSHSRSPGQETFLWRTHLLTRINVVNPIVNLPFGHLGMVYTNLFVVDFGDGLSLPHGSVSKPCTPSVHIKIAGIYGCSSP